VFLVGHPRSGTTFLGRLLGTHPCIGYWEEPGLLHTAVTLLDRLTILSRHLVLDAGVDIFSLTKVATREQLVLDPQRRQEADHLALTLVRDQVRGLQSEFQRRADKQILLEKTPTQVLALDCLTRIFPRAKAVHIVRDPRDVAASTLALVRQLGWPSWLSRSGPDPVRVVGQQWSRFAARGISAQRQLGSSSLFTLRYEQLIFGTEETLRSLLQFLGVAWSPELDRFLASGFGGGIQTSMSGVWRRLLSPEQIEVVEEETSDLMAQYGYVRACEASDAAD
jgi:hypothetical protein